MSAEPGGLMQFLPLAALYVLGGAQPLILLGLLGGMMAGLVS
jgi:hypothetical protein